MVWPKAPKCYYIHEIKFSGHFFLSESYVIAAFWENLNVSFAPVQTKKYNRNSCNEFACMSRKNLGYIIIWKQSQRYFLNRYKKWNQHVLTTLTLNYDHLNFK